MALSFSFPFLRLLPAAAFFFCLLAEVRSAQAADEQQAFQTWWQTEMAPALLARGIAPETLDRVGPTLAFDPDVIDLDRRQPEKTIPFSRYVHNALPSSRLDKGRALMRENAGVLASAEASYGVPGAALIALWGMESSFGENGGDNQTVNALASLAYEGRRAAFFKNELAEALLIVQEEGIVPYLLQGSWAGAMGQCQFMPSTYRRYAVDGDGDGRRDIWGSLPDVFASMARYLNAEGWQRGLVWGHEVKAMRPLPSTLVGLDSPPREASFWQKQGLRDARGRALPLGKDATYVLIQPDGAAGRSFLVTDNFRALMRWNRSTYFATTAGLFMDKMEEDGAGLSKAP